MKKSNRVIALLLIAASLTALCGCLQSSAPGASTTAASTTAPAGAAVTTAPAATAAPAPAPAAVTDVPGIESRFKNVKADVTLKLAIASAAADNKEWRAAAAFRDYVEAQTNGKLQINIYPSAQLGSEREAFEAVTAGDIDMSTAADGAIGGFVPAVGAISIPYLFASGPIAWAVLDGEFGQKLSAAVEEKTSVKVLAIGEDGFRSFGTNRVQVKTIEDLKGMKIRVMQNEVYLKMMSALGANPVAMAGGDELYNALQQGVVDGFENAPDVMYSFKIYEVIDYLTIDAHTFGSAWLSMSRKSFNALDDNFKSAVLNGANIWKGLMRAPKESAAIDAQAKMADHVDVYVMPPTEIERLKEASQPAVIEYMRTAVGTDWVDLILKSTKEAELSILGR